MLLGAYKVLGVCRSSKDLLIDLSVELELWWCIKLREPETWAKQGHLRFWRVLQRPGGCCLHSSDYSLTGSVNVNYPLWERKSNGEGGVRFQWLYKAGNAVWILIRSTMSCLYLSGKSKAGSRMGKAMTEHCWKIRRKGTISTRPGREQRLQVRQNVKTRVSKTKIWVISSSLSYLYYGRMHACWVENAKHRFKNPGLWSSMCLCVPSPGLWDARGLGCIMFI